jgi:hypothetical protein
MKYKILGNTGLVASQLCLGTMTFSDGSGVYKHIGNVDQTGAEELVNTGVKVRRFTPLPWDQQRRFMSWAPNAVLPAGLATSSSSGQIQGDAFPRAGLATVGVLRTLVRLREGARPSIEKA